LNLILQIMYKIVLILSFYLINYHGFCQLEIPKRLSSHDELTYDLNFGESNELNFNNKRLVAVGEATHNSHEENLARCSIIKRLVLKHGYSTIFVEAKGQSISELNNYIQSVGEETNVEGLVFRAPKLYWIWKTHEFINLLNWLREYNLSNEDKVSIVGVDTTSFNTNRDSIMAVNIQKYLNENEGVKAIFLAHNGHVVKRPMHQERSPLHCKPAGYYLDDMLGDEYFPIGIFFGTGSFNAVLKSRFYSLDTMHVSDIWVKGLTKYLRKAFPKKTVFYNLGLNKDRIFSKRTKVWSYGAMHENANSISYEEIVPVEYYDGMIYIDEITPASNLMMPGNYFAKIEKHFRVKDSSIRGVNAFVNLSRENNYDTSSINICIKTYNKNKLVTYKEAYVHPRFDSKAFQLETAIDGPIDLIIVSVLLIGEDEFKINSLEVNVEEEGKAKTIFVEDFKGEKPPNLDYYTRNFSREIKNGSLIIKRKGNS